MHGHSNIKQYKFEICVIPLFFSMSLGMPQMFPDLNQDGQTFSVLHSVQADSGAHLASGTVDFQGCLYSAGQLGHDV